MDYPTVVNLTNLAYGMYPGLRIERIVDQGGSPRYVPEGETLMTNPDELIAEARAALAEYDGLAAKFGDRKGRKAEAYLADGEAALVADPTNRRISDVVARFRPALDAVGQRLRDACDAVAEAGL